MRKRSALISALSYLFSRLHVSAGESSSYRTCSPCLLVCFWSESLSRDGQDDFRASGKPVSPFSSPSHDGCSDYETLCAGSKGNNAMDETLGEGAWEELKRDMTLSLERIERCLAYCSTYSTEDVFWDILKTAVRETRDSLGGRRVAQTEDDLQHANWTLLWCMIDVEASTRCAIVKFGASRKT